MKRIEEFECKLDALLEEFSDVSRSDMAESFAFYEAQMRMKS